MSNTDKYRDYYCFVYVGKGEEIFNKVLLGIYPSQAFLIADLVPNISTASRFVLIRLCSFSMILKWDRN